MKKNKGLTGRPLLNVVAVSLLVSIIGALLLFAVSFIPTERIQDHAMASAYQINDEGWPINFYTVAGHIEFQRGTTPDAVSVMTAYTLDRQHPDNVMLKKVYKDPSVLGWYRRLVETVEGRETMTESYSRYWMGFRVPIRLMLLVTAFYGMRILAAAADCILLVLAAATTAKRGSAWTGLALTASLLLIEPWAIIGTLCYSTCILLALLLIVWLNCAKLELSDDKTMVLFCLFGALTQYFDFYTYPLLVCALPLLVLMSRYEGERRLYYMARLCAVWFASWIVTWLFNLLFVTLFSAENGFAPAFQSAAYRLGVKGFRSSDSSYSIPEAFSCVWSYLKLPSAKWTVPLLIGLLAALFAYSRVRFGKNGRLGGYLAVCLLPLLWITVTAQPIIIHTSMQYRNVCVLYCALLLYLFEALGLSNGKSRLARKLWKD